MVVWKAVTEFFAPTITKLVAAVLLAGFLFVGYKAWERHVYTKGRDYERNLILTNIEQTQSKEIEQAQQARADADGAVRDAGFAGLRDDPFNRDNHCTDPKGQQCRGPVEGAGADQEGGSAKR